jgi:hypothetical protein
MNNRFFAMAIAIAIAIGVAQLLFVAPASAHDINEHQITAVMKQLCGGSGLSQASEMQLIGMKADAAVRLTSAHDPHTGHGELPKK